MRQRPGRLWSVSRSSEETKSLLAWAAFKLHVSFLGVEKTATGGVHGDIQLGVIAAGAIDDVPDELIILGVKIERVENWLVWIGGC
jgi:hypothetical protein